jgi:hypothetical protein
MSFSIQWPVMPKLGPVDIHGVGNQDYSTGFHVQYMGPKGRVTLYVNHYLTDDLQLAFMHREDGQYRHSTGFRVDGDALEAELAVRKFVASDGNVVRPAGKHTTNPDIWDSYRGAATAGMRANEDAIKELRRYVKVWGGHARAAQECAFGMTPLEIAEQMLQAREKRQEALQGVLDTLGTLNFRTTPSQVLREAVARPELKTDFPNFTVNDILPPSEVIRAKMESEGTGRAIFASAGNQISHLISAEPLYLGLRLPQQDPFKSPEALQPGDISGDDLLIVSGGAILETQILAMKAFQAIRTNPSIVILTPNGNLTGRLTDFTPEMLARPTIGPKI